MRPKIVILTLVFAVGLVALAGVFKVISGHHAASGEPPTAPAEPVQEANQSVPAVPISSNSAAIKEQLRAAEISKELDQIRDLILQDAENPSTVGILVGKVTHPEPAVRSAALQAVVSLNDTNAVPMLEKAAEAIDDPREKVAVMDAIEYLKLPDGMPATPLTDAPMVTSTSAPPWSLNVPRDKQKKAASSRAQRRLDRMQRQNQQQAAAAPAQAQPAAPTPGSAPPQ